MKTFRHQCIRPRAKVSSDARRHIASALNHEVVCSASSKCPSIPEWMRYGLAVVQLAPPARFIAAILSDQRERAKLNQTTTREIVCSSI
jgi:hypothetical protein